MAIFPLKQKLEIFTHREEENEREITAKVIIYICTQLLLVLNLAFSPAISGKSWEKVKWWVRRRNGNLFSS